MQTARTQLCMKDGDSCSFIAVSVTATADSEVKLDCTEVKLLYSISASSMLE